MSLYEKLGGAPAVNAAVELFYRKVLSDNRISHFFDTVDMERLLSKQQAFLTMAFGGPHDYTGRDLRAAHKQLNLNDKHFNAVAGCLLETLRELSVGKEDIDSVMKIVLSVKQDVLNQ